MTCGEILEELLLSRRGPDIPLPDGVAQDSRKVVPGGVFVAVPGSRTDGHDFIPQAEKTAAAIVLVREPRRYAPGVTYYFVSDAGAAAALLFRAKYGSPDKSLKLLGVTGTNGKTTTAFLMRRLLGEERCGLLSTVVFRTGKADLPATHTTPDAETFFSLLREMAQNGFDFCSLELSSHALAQRRTAGARFRAAVFTNLTGDHLDYHGDMEHYYQAKKRFFTELLSPGGIAVVNTGDPYGARLAGELAGQRRVATFGSPDAQWRIEELQSGREGLSFVLRSRDASLPVYSNLIGAFNACNLAGAILAVMDCGVPFSQIDDALRRGVTVPGRMQFLSSPSGAGFVVDYAHTDDALRNVISTLRPLTRNRLFCVFGAGGDRDRTKRPRMGLAASSADHLIVTSDNPRSEEPEKIIGDIVSGIPQGASFETVPDRRAAICRACALAGPGDIVLVAGKGHENYQEIKGVRNHFSDAEVISNCFEHKESL